MILALAAVAGSASCFGVPGSDWSWANGTYAEVDYPSGDVLQPAGTMGFRAVGVAMDEGEAVIGMGGSLACVEDAQSGAIGDDWSFLTADEPQAESCVVQENGTRRCAVIADGDVYTVRSHLQPVVLDGEGGAIAARLTDDGLVVLARRSSQECAVRALDGEQRVWDATVACSGTVDIAIDPTGDTAWVASTAGVFEVSRDGAALLGDGATVAYDDSRGVLVIGSTDGLVEAFGPDGSVLWTADLGGVATAMAPLPGFAAVAVAVADGDGSRLVLLDEQGAIREELAHAARIEGLHASPSGGWLGVSRTNDHGYYVVAM